MTMKARMIPAIAIPLAVALASAAPAVAQSTKTTEKEVEKTAVGVVEKPLEDANIKKTKVPPELERIMANPYSTVGIKTCADYSAAVAELTRILGPDVDSPQAKASGGSATEFVLGAGAELAGGLVPFSGLIRKVSGAEKAQKHAAAAVLAGNLRRAFLKGSGRAKGCKIV